MQPHRPARSPRGHFIFMFALALWVRPALAEPIVTNAVVTLSAGETSFDRGPTADFQAVAASAGVMTTRHINVEGQAGYVAVSSLGAHTSQMTLRGVILWAEPKWRFAATAGHIDTDSGRAKGRVTNAHVYVVWFPATPLTLAAKAGRFSGTNRGSYVGTASNIYVARDIGIFTAVDAASFDSGFRERSYTTSLSVLPIERIPAAINIGVTRTTISGCFRPEEQPPLSVCACSSIAAVRRRFEDVSGRDRLAGPPRLAPWH